MKDSSPYTIQGINPTTDQDVVNLINNKAREILASCPTRSIDINISALLKVIALQIYAELSNFGRAELDQDEVTDALERATEIIRIYVLTDNFKSITDQGNLN